MTLGSINSTFIGLSNIVDGLLIMPIAHFPSISFLWALNIWCFINRMLFKFYLKFNLKTFLLIVLKMTMSFLFSFGLGRSKVLVLRFGPKMNTKVAFNTTTTLNFLTNSRHSGRLKLGTQLNQTKPNPNLKKKISLKSLKKILKKSLKSFKRLNFQAKQYSI